MSDRELLELAAKAAGVVGSEFGSHWCDKHEGNCAGIQVLYPDTDRYYFVWNPLEDDGDCARLEAAIGIDVLWLKDEVHCRIGVANSVAFRGVFADHGGDRNKAKRWASVHVAAFMQRCVNEAAWVMP